MNPGDWVRVLPSDWSIWAGWTGRLGVVVGLAPDFPHLIEVRPKHMEGEPFPTIMVEPKTLLLVHGDGTRRMP